MLPPASAAELTRRGHDATMSTTSASPARTTHPCSTRRWRRAASSSPRTSPTTPRAVDQRLRNDGPCVPVVFVRKTDLSRRGALARQLAERLHSWATTHPDPYLGAYWP
jgi:hypothetical protein